MAYNIKTDWLTPNKYSRPTSKLSSMKGIVVHWTANPNADAQANVNYFESRKNGGRGYGSAHEFISWSGDVLRCVPPYEMTYAVGSKTYTGDALRSLSSYPNNCTYNIECCVTDMQGNMTKETMNTLAERIADLCNKYNLNPHQDLWLHKTVVGWKNCHLYYINNPSEWKKLKNKVNSLMSDPMADGYLEKDEQGEEVKELQLKLLKIGYNLPKYGADAHYGDETISAVTKFQKDEGLTVDGLAGQEVWSTLNTKINNVKAEDPEHSTQSEDSVDKSDWQKEKDNVTEWAKENGISDLSKLYEEITRLQLIVMLHRTTSDHENVNEWDEEKYNAVIWAAVNEISSLERIDDSPTRIELLVMLHRKSVGAFEGSWEDEKDKVVTWAKENSISDCTRLYEAPTRIESLVMIHRVKEA